MLTTVRRDILDKSISGNKIFGGIINYIDGLHTTNINVPQSAAVPSAGTGLIDGLGVLIGSRSKVGNVQSNIIGAHTTLGLRRAVQPTAYSFIAQEVGTGVQVLFKRTAVNGAVRIQLHAGNQSYFLDKLMVGRSSQIQSGVVFEAPTGYIDNLLWDTASGQSADVNLIRTFDPDDSWTSLTDIIGRVYNLEDIILNGMDLVEPLQTLVDSMTDAQALQLCNIIEAPEITSDNWNILPSLNQNLSDTDTPSFEGIHIGAGPLPTGSSNTLLKYYEWVNRPIDVKFYVGVAEKISYAAKCNIVKNGKLVTLSFLGTGGSQKLIFQNGSSPIVGGDFRILFDDTIYDAILTNAPIIGAGMLCYEIYNDTNVFQSRKHMFGTAPMLSDPRIFLRDFISSDFKIDLTASYTIKIPQFSLSYAIDR